MKFKLLFALAIIIFFLINLFGLSQNVKDFFSWFSLPLQKILWQAEERTADFFSTFSAHWDFKKREQQCQTQRKKLLSELAEAEQLKEENKALREALALNLQKEFKLILVRATGLDSTNDTLFLDKGKAEGLSKDLPVITSAKVLVGKISKVHNQWSEVQLISNPQISLPVSLLKKDISGIAKGKGNFRLSLENLPKNKEVSRGNVVVTSALAKTFPPGLLVGEILKTETSDIEPFQKAHLSFFFDPNKLDYLFVIKAF